MATKNAASGKANNQQLSDEEIIELYWKRNEEAIAQTDIKYGKYLLTIAYNIVHDRQDSEECLNDTYVGTWNAIPPARPTALRAFLTTIMRRIAINRYYSNQKATRVPSEMTVALSEIEAFTDDGTSVEQEADARRIGQVISRYLRTLTKRQRYIFMSRYYVASTVDSIASSLHVSRSTVNKQLALMRKGLKQALESEGYNV